MQKKKKKKANMDILMKRQLLKNLETCNSMNWEDKW